MCPVCVPGGEVGADNAVDEEVAEDRGEAAAVEKSIRLCAILLRTCPFPLYSCRETFPLLLVGLPEQICHLSGHPGFV